MAYAKGYKYDIFISYSHTDNKEPGGNVGWVTELESYLKNWLINKRHLKGLEIWIDHHLDGNTIFDKAIESRIKESALFFAIHSRSYQESEYCKKELDWFYQHNINRPEGLRIGDSSRLFNILVNNIKYTDWPQALSNAGGPTSGFIFHDREQSEDDGYPTPIHKQQLYDKQIRKIVKAAAKTLELFPKSVEPDNYISSKRPTIFLADVADSLSALRKRLVSEVGETAHILPSIPPPYDTHTHDSDLIEALSKADLSIHLLDHLPGRDVIGMEGETFPRRQTDISIGSGVSTIVWTPDTLSDQDFEDDGYLSWVKSFEFCQSKNTDYQLVQSNKQQLIDLVTQRVNRFSLTQHSDKTSRFLIDSHEKDQRFAFDLSKLLTDQGVPVRFNGDYDDPQIGLTEFENAVRAVQNLVIMFGQVSPSWVTNRIDSIAKIFAKQKSKGNEILNQLWIIFLPGYPGVFEVPSVHMPKYSLLDNSKHDQITEESLNRLMGKEDEH